jgi:16S rRNA pseudouridine516 synthase
MRLDKFIVKSTAFNKQQVQHHISSSHIKVNGTIVDDCRFQVHENNTVIFQGKRLVTRPFRYILMHKPSDTICSNIDDVYPSVLNSLKQSNVDHVDQLHIAGRLDADTTGLILITDDGRWTFDITQPINDCSKVYRVGLSRPFDLNLQARFEEGIQLQGETTLTLPAKVALVNDKEVLLTISEGKFHQVKRMFAALGNRVVSLHREQIGDVMLDVEVGKWRYLTPLEIGSFRKKKGC